jgi:glyoxylase-like metal-dependent hydrolase (beta-lactamase superfamily II)
VWLARWLWHTGFMHRMKLGDFELTVFSDGTYPLDGGAFFGVMPKVMWSKRVTADDRNFVTAGLNSLLIRTGKQTVLVETGMGNKLSDRMAKIYGQPAQLLTNLAAGGVRPEDIDVVINTHLHFDHCGWNTVRKDGKVVATFPRAKYYAPEGEWQYARKPSERDAISYVPDNYDPLVASGQMTLLQGGEEIVPGISVKTFPGHTASMQAVIIRGKSPSGAKAQEILNALRGPEGPLFHNDPGHKERGTRSSSATSEAAPFPVSTPATACYISDLIPTTAHIDITWGMGFDLYPLQTVDSKKEYYAQSIPEKWLTVFTHDPKTPWAYVERDELGKMVAKSPG